MKLLAYAAAVVVGVAAPLLSASMRPDDGPRCARDGVEIGNLLTVRVEAADDARLSFCSVRCAEDWISRTDAAVARVLVSDEPTGEPLDAGAAFYVRSRVVTSRATGESVHTFRSREDAEAHVEAFGGMLLERGERPFRRQP